MRIIVRDRTGVVTKVRPTWFTVRWDTKKGFKDTIFIGEL